MKLVALVAASLFVCSPALAKSHHKHHFQHSTKQHRHYHRHGARSESSAYGTTSGRPSAWCGWFARHNLVSSDPGPEYNLAREWAHWGREVVAKIGAIVVWPHHVGKIVGGSEGHWVVESGNDGHRVRTRERSVATAIAFRE